LGVSEAPGTRAPGRARTLLPARRLRRGVAKLAQTTALALDPRRVVATWPRVGPVGENWGDKLNPVLIERISGRRVVHEHDVVAGWAPAVHAVIGSMLGELRGPRWVVWGSGFLRADDRLHLAPAQVRAVRGPASLARAGLDPARTAVGDPGLLAPLLFDVEAEASGALGLVAHFRDAARGAVDELAGDGVRVIDIRGPLEDVLHAIRGCRAIVSSSLHGLVAADALGVPNAWITLAGGPRGDGFKFRDYLASVGRTALTTPVADRADLERAAARAEGPRRRLDLTALVERCPFADDAARERLLRRIPERMPDAFR
jgi:hypothetical protein